MRGIKYIGPYTDFSGYGQAARDYILALYKKGIPITISLRSFDVNPPPIADKEEAEILKSLADKPINYDVVVIHLTPDLWPRHVERGKLNVGFAAWETSLLHPLWAKSAGSVDRILVPCQWNVEAFKNSEVGKPVYKVPHGIRTDMFDDITDYKFNIKGLEDSTFKFYSIFQWMYRKNPEGLIRAYFNAFDDTDNVALVLKAYRMGMSRDKEYIRNEIVNIKKDMNIGRYPRIILIGDILSDLQMRGLHIYGDCYVGLPRGEGWGLPFFQAGLAGNPVIAPNAGGQVEFLKEDNSYLVDTIQSYVKSMSTFNPWYLGNGEWYESNLVHASMLMREVYDNRKEAYKKGEKLKHSIINNFSWDKVADIMVSCLNV